MSAIKEYAKQNLWANVIVRRALYFVRNSPVKYYDIMGHSVNHSKCRVFVSMIYNLWRYGYDYQEYFFYGVYKSSSQEKKSFITEGNRSRYYKWLNHYVDVVFFDDKIATYKLFKEFYKRDLIDIRESTLEEIELFFRIISVLLQKFSMAHVVKA